MASAKILGESESPQSEAGRRLAELLHGIILVTMLERPATWALVAPMATLKSTPTQSANLHLAREVPGRAWPADGARLARSSSRRMKAS